MSDKHDSAKAPEQSPLENDRGIVPPFDVYVDTVAFKSPPEEPVGTNLSIYAARLVKRLADRSSDEYDQRFDRWLMAYLANRRSRGAGGRPEKLDSAKIAAEFRFYTETMNLSNEKAFERISRSENVAIRTVRTAVNKGLNDPYVTSLVWTQREEKT